MIKRPMFAYLAAVLIAIALSRSGWPAAGMALGAYALFLFLLFLFSERSPKRFSKFFKQRAYGSLALLLALLPLVFVLSFVLIRNNINRAYERRAAYEKVFENGEEEIVVSGTLERRDLKNGTQILTLGDAAVKGYYENIERSGGGCRIYTDISENIKCGTVIRVYGRFYFVEEPSNPGEYDPVPKSLRENIHANIYAGQVWILGNENTQKAVYVLKELLCIWRTALEESLLEIFGEADGGIMIAMITGDRDYETNETKDLYKGAGISHILAVSGLHVSILCLGLWRILKKSILGKRGATFVTFIFILFFIVFTGAPVSAVRAGIMCSVLLLGKLVRKHYDMPSGIALSGIVILMFWPMALSDPSFILSFTAIIGVFFAMEADIPVLFGTFVTIFTMPVTAFFFFEIPTFAFLANAVVIPLAAPLLGVGITAGLLGCLSPVLGKVAGGGAVLILKVFEKISFFTSNLPFSRILTGKPEVWEIIIIYGAIIAGFGALVLRKDKNMKNKMRTRGVTSVSLFALVILLSLTHPKREMAFLSVGQGDCAVYISNGDSVLFDCGSTSKSGAGLYVLSPYMRSKGIILIGEATVSHTDADHINGITEILENMNVYKNRFDYAMRYNGNIGIRKLILPKVREQGEAYLELLVLAKTKNVEVEFLEAGDEIELRDKDSRLICLWPNEAEDSRNETSMVFLLDTPSFRAYMTGDAGTEAERETVKALPDILSRSEATKKMTVLKVGHHGSRTSTSEEFLNLIQPDLAVISCGRNNIYGHPHREVLAILEDAGVTVHRTDKDGAVVVGR